jgi:hypothetical protein
MDKDEGEAEIRQDDVKGNYGYIYIRPGSGERYEAP